MKPSTFVRAIALVALGTLWAGARPSAAAGEPRMPVHGVVLALAGGRAIVRLDAVTGMLPAGTYDARIGRARLETGEPFDALAVRDGRSVALVDPVRADRFAAGLPNRLITHVVGVGDTLPEATLVDQRGAAVDLAGLRGKTVLLSFTFTRCPDKTICPAITSKFAYLQKRLDPARFHLVEITLDPSYDSPAVMARYGAQFDANPARWSLLDGRAYDVRNLMDSFGISSVEDAADNFVHDDRLIIVDPKGVVRDIIPTAGWSADDVIAQARDVAGLESNPFRRFELASVAGIVALCGGSPSTGLVVLDSTVFVLGVGILGTIIVRFGRRIFSDG